ncbi:hypothetical protein EZV62_022797 [Acer yangbiense]|uniref:Dof zinc finger protein n=1 Tax=Acer yangbiense TaxID=1000413 RepID=A0A5C7H028_9ROSI|nr:hypothetical protein EZV62_022797 [Acer yangbiense]
MKLDVVCPICLKRAKTTLHALWHCSSLKGVREKFGLAEGGSVLDAGSFLDFILSVRYQVGVQEFGSFCVLWWRIWHRRNLFFHQHSLLPDQAVYDWMVSFCLDFSSAVGSGCNQVVSCKPKACWQAPPSGVYKINTDAAINSQRKCSGLGVGSIHEDSGLDSSSPSGGDMLTCSRPLIERRLRPPHDQAIKCPRCESTHTKFCYYNNYSLSQPRYFCKTCRRYWTKGGTLRNIPVGGGCRKNKKVASKKSNDNINIHNQPINQNPGSSSSLSHHHNPTDLQLSFPHHEMQFSHHLGNILGSSHHHGTLSSNPNFMLDHHQNNHPRPIDFMDSKLEAIVGSSSRINNNYDFMGNGEMGMVGNLAPNVHGICSPFGMSLDGNNGATFMDTCQRLMLPYDANDQDQSTIDVKPNTKLLSLDWQDQGCSDAGKLDTFGYNLSNLGSWTGMMNNYGSSATNSLV